MFSFWQTKEQLFFEKILAGADYLLYLGTLKAKFALFGTKNHT